MEAARGGESTQKRVDKKMRAVRVHDYGDSDQLIMEQIARPKPKKGEVLVKIYSAGVNPVDWKLRKYAMPSRPITFPFTLGFDLAGVVEDVGPEVTMFEKGQAVLGRGSGSYAEYAIASEASLVLKPDNITFDQAAAVPIGARTAWVALFVLGNLEENQQLLIHGAAGGVGHFAVQFGRWKQAHVTGTCSKENVDFVKSLGAETVIDYNETPFEEVVHDVDVVVDPIGGDVEERSWQVLKSGGVFVTLTHPIPPSEEQQHGGWAFSTILSPELAAKITIEPLEQIAELIISGEVIPQVGSIFTLEEASQAQDLSEGGHGRGRIILHIAD